MSPSPPSPPVEFWSNVEFGTFMKRVISCLREDGHEAEERFLISAPSYRAAKAFFPRLWLRLRMYGLYPLMLVWRLLTDRRPAVLVVSTNTFFAPLIATCLGSRKHHRIVHLVYDLFPDALTQAGMVSPQGLTCRLLENVKQATFARCAANVFLGERLRDHALAGNPATRPVVIPVGADESAFARLTDPQPASGPVTILYCGNLGHMHDTGAVAAALASGDPVLGGCVFQFHARGPRFNALRENLADVPPQRVRWGDRLSAGDWEAAMRSASVGLVTMSAGAERIVMPSKAYSALAAGQAILAVAPADSDLAKLVHDHDCGWVTPPGDGAALIAALGEISRPDELARRRRNALKAARTDYSGPAVAAHWTALIKTLW